MTRKDFITFAKFHGDFIYDLYSSKVVQPQDLQYVDRLLKNHLISIFKTDNSRFDIGRYKTFIYDYLIKEYGFDMKQFEEDMGKEMEFDPVAICCEYSEYENLEEIKKNYDCIENYEDLENKVSGFLDIKKAAKDSRNFI